MQFIEDTVGAKEFFKMKTENQYTFGAVFLEQTPEIKAAVMQENVLPKVSFIIATRNAAEHIGGILTDSKRQDYPVNKMEILVIDGGSEDNTKDIVQDFAERHRDLKTRILDNPKKTQAPALNIGIQAADGEVVFLIDAQTSIPPDYLRKAVSLLISKRDENVVCVGGRLLTLGKGFWGTAIAAALSSPFGVGNSKFRYAKNSGMADTVPYPLIWKRVFDKIGLFREDLDRNFDNEFNARVRLSGWKFFLCCELNPIYFCRSTLHGMACQAFRNGYWSLIAWRQSSWRHLVPLVFVGTLAVLGIGSFFSKSLFYVVGPLGFIYTSLALYFGFKSKIGKSNLMKLIIFPPLYLLLHVSYGIGSWWALLEQYIHSSRNKLHIVFK